MKNAKFLFLFCSFWISVSFCEEIPQNVLQQIKHQLVKKDNIFDGRFPAYTNDGKWIFRKSPNWFAGFIAGELWLMYEITGEEDLKKRALEHADQLIPFAHLDNTHDMGFIFYPSCVKAYQMTGEEKYRNAAIQAAQMLVKRFNNKGNFIRAWGKLRSSDREGWSIIDTMMNLELLFWAAKQTCNNDLFDIAYRHALTSMKEHVRVNSSSYHVIEFDPKTGKLLRKFTH